MSDNVPTVVQRKSDLLQRLSRRSIEVIRKSLIQRVKLPEEKLEN